VCMEVGLSVMLRVYFLQQWFNLSDPGVEEALYESPVLRSLASLIGIGAFLYLAYKRNLNGNLSLPILGIPSCVLCFSGGLGWPCDSENNRSRCCLL